MARDGRAAPDETPWKPPGRPSSLRDRRGAHAASSARPPALPPETPLIAGPTQTSRPLRRAPSWAAAVVLAAAACGGEPAPADDEPAANARPVAHQEAPSTLPSRDVRDPPTARWPMVENLRADAKAERHPADGGGRAWIDVPEGESADAVARRSGRWTIVYEAGPEGVAAGGSIHLLVSPYWGWSEPWVDPDGEAPPRYRDETPGLCEVSTDVEGVELEAFAGRGEPRLFVAVGGRGLREGERVRIVYGAGAAGARADRYAERDAVFWIGVDGDGDGVHGLVPDPPRVDVAPGPAAQLVATLPSCVSPGEPAELVVAVLDGLGSTGVPFAGDVALGGSAEALGLPAAVTFDGTEEGRKRVSFTPSEEGVFRITAEGEEPLLALSNPVVVQAGVEPILWADLHGHSGLSDGTGTPEDYFAYARDVAALDVVALTDHDHWGFQFLDAHPRLWERIRDAVRAHHEPGRFVALLGYEWTSWIHGHRHVLDFDADEELPLLSSLDEEYETPRQLWDALAGQPALTFAHHSAGGPIATNWSFRPDPEIEPVTEVVSVHGSSEARDSPLLIYSPVPGNFVRDVLDAGLRFGFVGSGDSHDGHPGMAHLAGASGGVAAVLTGDRTRQGVLTALRQRRVYATSGARMILRCTIAGARMGETLAAPEEEAVLTLIVHGTAPIERADIVRSGAVIDRIDLSDEPSFDLWQSWRLSELGPEEYVYVRVVQTDGHVGWTSPFYFE